MSGDLYESVGILRYSIGSEGGFKLVVEIDPGIMKFYRSLIPKYIQTNVPMYAPHISIVRKEIQVNMEHWGKYEGQEAKFVYSSFINFGEVYCWLNCFSTRFEEIRTELGLPVSTQYTLPPEGFVKCFHTTIGNFK